jgi:undecaprenyl-diphosphatase
VLFGGASAILAISVSIYANSVPYFPYDLDLTLALQSVHSNSLLLIMKWVSYIHGSWRAAFIVLATGSFIWFRFGRLQAILIIVAGLSCALNYAIKMIIDRPRPGPELVQVWTIENGNGFPSGHAFFAMVVLGFGVYLVLEYIQRSNLKVILAFSLIILIIFIGVSRVYLGAHWPSDVLGGYLNGSVLLCILILIDRRIRKPQVRKHATQAS